MNKVLTLIVLSVGLCGCKAHIDAPVPDTPAGHCNKRRFLDK